MRQERDGYHLAGTYRYAFLLFRPLPQLSGACSYRAEPDVASGRSLDGFRRPLQSLVGRLDFGSGRAFHAPGKLLSLPTPSYGGGVPTLDLPPSPRASAETDIATRQPFFASTSERSVGYSVRRALLWVPYLGDGKTFAWLNGDDSKISPNSVTLWDCSPTPLPRPGPHAGRGLVMATVLSKRAAGVDVGSVVGQLPFTRLGPADG